MEKSHITVSQMEGAPNYLACGSTDTKPFYSSSILLRFRWQYLKGSMNAVNLGYSCVFPIAPPKSKSLGLVEKTHITVPEGQVDGTPAYMPCGSTDTCIP